MGSIDEKEKIKRLFTTLGYLTFFQEELIEINIPFYIGYDYKKLQSYMENQGSLIAKARNFFSDDESISIFETTIKSLKSLNFKKRIVKSDSFPYVEKFIINNNYSKLNQQILTINDKIESIQIHMSILNELVYSEINNNNISRTNAIEKMTNLIAPLEKRIINIETKENYVLIGYRKSTDIPVFVSTEIIKLSNEEIKKYHLQETCIILPLLTALPKLKEINMTQLEGLWLSFEKIISKNPCTDKLMYAGIHMQLGSEIKPINSVFKHNIPKIESFCNSIGVKLIIE
jgi:hypothetical protein